MTAPEERIVRIVWEWIGDHYNYSHDAETLILNLEHAGYPCPDDLKEN